MSVISSSYPVLHLSIFSLRVKNKRDSIVFSMRVRDVFKICKKRSRDCKLNPQPLFFFRKTLLVHMRVQNIFILSQQTDHPCIEFTIKITTTPLFM